MSSKQDRKLKTVEITGEPIPPSDESPKIGIGALSKATGVPVETLRTWERRYGFPDPERTEGGHRLYQQSVIEHIRWVVRAIDVGHRASHVVKMPLDQVKALVVRTASDDELDVEPASPPADVPADTPWGEARERVLADWLTATGRLDAATLQRGLRTWWARMGTIDFVAHCVGPFLQQVGDRWSDGTFSVAHEHLASEVVRDFLAGLWRAIPADPDAPRLVFSTLPGEQHHLGLHMAAAVAALSGVRIAFLGMSCPLHDIASAAVQEDAAAVVVSVSTAMSHNHARALLVELSDRLPDGVQVVVGGAGAPLDGPNALGATDFRSFSRWVETLRHG